MPIRFQVDPDFYDHPKSIGMSDAATALWVRAGSYSAAKLLDGFIAEHVLPTLSRVPETAAGELVSRGLWKRVKGGYRFHQYDERNLTRARVEGDRAHERDKKRRQREGTRNLPQDPVDNASEPDPTQVNTGYVPRGHPEGIPQDKTGTPGSVPPLSVSMSVSESVSGSGHAEIGGPEPPSRCSKHLDDPDPPNCGRCADARRNRDSWLLAEAARKRNAPKCPQHRGQPADNCAMCRAEELERPRLHAVRGEAS